MTLHRAIRQPDERPSVSDPFWQTCSMTLVEALSSLPLNQYVVIRREMPAADGFVGPPVLTAVLYRIEGDDVQFPSTSEDRVLAGVSADGGDERFVELVVALVAERGP